MSGESHPIATSHDQGENATNIHKEITYLFKNHAIPSNRLIAAVDLMLKSQRIHWSALSASSRLDTHGDKKNVLYGHGTPGTKSAEPAVLP